MTEEAEARIAEGWIVQNGQELDGSGFVGFWASGPVRGSRSEAEADIPPPEKVERTYLASITSIDLDADGMPEVRLRFHTGTQDARALAHLMIGNKSVRVKAPL